MRHGQIFCYKITSLDDIMFLNPVVVLLNNLFQKEFKYDISRLT